MATTPLTWDNKARKLDADPLVTIALDRAAWEAVGAKFIETDDGDGETPGLATATVSTRRGALSIGVLDYGGETTYMLVPKAASVTSLLRLLSDVGVLKLDTDVVEVAKDALTAMQDDLLIEVDQHETGLVKTAKSTPAFQHTTTRQIRSKPRSKPTKPSSMSASTRLQLERATKRLETSLQQANDALKALGRDVGHSGRNSYKDIGTGLSALRRDAKDANRTLVADLKKLRATVTSGKPAPKKSSRSGKKGKSRARAPAKRD